MADEGGDKTEDATARRREDARQQGQVATSQDFTGSVLLLAGIIGLMMMGRGIGGGMLDIFRTDLPQLRHNELDTATTREIFIRLFSRGVLLVSGLFGLLIAAAILVNIVQVGFHITPDRLEVNFDKLNPASGLQKLFSVAAVVRGVLATAKIVALGIIAYLVLHGRAGTITSLGYGTLPEAVASAWALTLRIALFMAIVLTVLGIADFVYQKQRFEGTLRMSKQEVKDEMKREEGDPLIKSRIRQLARERARRKMLSAVPKATVVITNPQHLAIALEYHQGTGKKAPVVLAKGSGLLAKRIVQLARKHGIPVLERPPVAQLLYKSVSEGQEIPPAMFRVVAEILALVYKLRSGG